jgi:hypothetical protein
VTTRRTRAHGLAELMVAVGLVGLLIAALMLGRIGPGWSVFDPLAGDSPELGAAEQQLRKLVAEIHDSTRVFYPFPGAAPADGIGIATARGEAVLYYLEPSADPSRPSTIVRSDLVAAQAGREPGPVAFLGKVRHLRIGVAPAAPGKQPSLVDIDLMIELSDRAGRGVRQVNLVTSAFPRALETASPDDVFAPGTPLIDP